MATVCDDCTIQLSARITGSVSLEIALWKIPGFTLSGTGSGELHGDISANWKNKKFAGGGFSVRMTGWIGLKGGDDLGVASLSGDVGLGASWTSNGITGDESSIGISGTGGPVNFNARARVTLTLTKKWKYNEEILRYSTQIGKAPDFNFSIPVASFAQ